MRRLLLTMLAVSAVGCCWLRRGLLKSMAMRGLIAVLPDPAKRHGIDMRFPIDRGAWTRYTLHADLSLALSGVLDHVVEAAAYSHYGGFKLNNVYSDFLNPDSPYYQAWIGAYVVLDNDRRKHFGFDDLGKACAAGGIGHTRGRPANGVLGRRLPEEVPRRAPGEARRGVDGHRGGLGRRAVVEAGWSGGDVVGLPPRQDARRELAALLELRPVAGRCASSSGRLPPADLYRFHLRAIPAGVAGDLRQVLHLPRVHRPERRKGDEGTAVWRRSARQSRTGSCSPRRKQGGSEEWTSQTTGRDWPPDASPVGGCWRGRRASAVGWRLSPWWAAAVEGTRSRHRVAPRLGRQAAPASASRIGDAIVVPRIPPLGRRPASASRARQDQGRHPEVVRPRSHNAGHLRSPSDPVRPPVQHPRRRVQQGAEVP